MTVRDVCRVLSLGSVSAEAGVTLVVRFVIFTSGSDVGFVVALERPLFCVFGTTWGRSSSRNSDFAEAFVRLFATAFFVVAFGFSSLCVSGSTFFVLFRRAGALIPQPDVASGWFSTSFDCVRARVDTMIDHSTEVIAVGTNETV